MAKKIFVNFPVRDLKKSIELFEAIGYKVNPHFSDDTAACLVISEDIYAMLLTHPKFKDFTPHAIADANKSTEVIIALSCDSKEEVGTIIKKALAAGATRYTEPKDYGFMIQDSFKDLDGHIWEYVYMDPSAIPPHG